MWTPCGAFAEALIQTSQEDRAQELYKYILTRCPNPAERLATVQKAMERLPVPAVKALMAAARYRADNAKAFELVQLDLLRRQIGAVASDATAPAVPPADLRSFEALVKQKKLSNDADLLGWYNYSLKSWPAAAEWFKQAMEWDKLPKAAEGYALALRQQGQLPEAEAAAYEWRNASPLIAKLFIEIVATALTQPNPATLDDTRLAAWRRWWRPPSPSMAAKLSAGTITTRTALPRLASGSPRRWPGRQTRPTYSDWRLRLTAPTTEPCSGRRSRITASSTKPLLHSKPTTGRRAQRASGRQPPDAGEAGEAVRHNPASSPMLQVEQFKNGQYREALATLDKRAAVAKEDQGLGVLRGWALYHLSQYDKARAQFTELDKKRSTRDTQYGMYYSGSKLDPLHLGD
jgi:tetratricopeptide (TPR) repeat protein